MTAIIQRESFSHTEDASTRLFSGGLMSVLRTGAGVVVGLTPVMASGCNGVFWGNLGVLSVTVAIFLGTVFLSRSKTPRGTASRSSASTSHHS